MPQSVLVVGSANLDLVFRTPRLPRPGETLLGGRFSTHPGGKGANQAVAIGRLSGDCAFVGCVGSDSFGETLKMSLQAAGVDTAWLRVIGEVPTGTAMIMVDEAGMNSIVVASGANFEVQADDVLKAVSTAKAGVVLAQLEIPLAAIEAAATAERFILNPAPARELPDALLQRCYAITPNETELEALTGIHPVDDESCVKAGSRLLDSGVENVVITLGARGSFHVGRSGGTHYPSPAIRAVDTTAAGDAFNGALAHFLAEGRRLSEAIGLANSVGALSATREGAQESMPTLAELKTFVPLLF